MADQQFPGFEGEDEEKPAKQPSAPPPAPARPATGKVAKGDADQPAAAPSAAPPGKVDYAFEESEEPAPKPKPKPAQPAGGATSGGKPGAAGGGRAPAGAAPVDEVDPEVKPGSRRDLWNCPHCGAGNRPGRDTCRTCGKSPDEVVIVPLLKKPGVLPAMIGGGVLVLVLLIWSLLGTDTSHRDATVDQIDSKPRIGGAGTSRQIGDKSFVGRQRFAAVGRCIVVDTFKPIPGAKRAVLMLGKQAKDLDNAINAKVELTDSGFIVHESVGPTLGLLLVGQPQTFKAGEIISIAGEVGTIDGLDPGAEVMTVFVEEFDQGG